jgi:hypothetical protein
MGRTVNSKPLYCNRKRFVVRAAEKLTAFLELESAIRAAANVLDKLSGFFKTVRR